ncbi:MAG: ferritin family protein [Flavobacteriales bacterium]
MNTHTILSIAAGLGTFLLTSCGGSDTATMQQPTEQPAANAPTANTAADTATTGTPAQAEQEGEEAGEERTEGAERATPGATTTVAHVASAKNTQNLLDALTGETTATAKYAAYAKKAEEEGYHAIAILFTAASKSEGIHAANHRSVLEENGTAITAINPVFTVKTTRENLQDAIAGETYEQDTMYPQFMAVANEVGDKLALISLNYAYKTEQKHKVFYEKALAALQANTVAQLPTVYYVCPTCGNTYDTNAPKRCGVSMTKGDRFIKINTLVGVVA